MGSNMHNALTHLKALQHRRNLTHITAGYEHLFVNQQAMSCMCLFQYINNATL